MKNFSIIVPGKCDSKCSFCEYQEKQHADDEIFEYIFHPTGLVTSDWAGKKIILKNNMDIEKRRNTEYLMLENEIYGGFRGCGNGGSGC